MDTKKLLFVLQKFKGRSKDEAFEKFFLTINKVLIEDQKTQDEGLLSAALEEETRNFQETRQKFFNCVEGVRQFEEVIRARDTADPEEHFCSSMLYTHNDSCEYMARQAFEYGVEYGKILAST